MPPSALTFHHLIVEAPSALPFPLLFWIVEAPSALPFPHLFWIVEAPSADPFPLLFWIVEAPSAFPFPLLFWIVEAPCFYSIFAAFVPTCLFKAVPLKQLPANHALLGHFNR